MKKKRTKSDETENRAWEGKKEEENEERERKKKSKKEKVKNSLPSSPLFPSPHSAREESLFPRVSSVEKIEEKEKKKRKEECFYERGNVST